MKFRTEIKLPKPISCIDHDSKLFLMGSCFSEHMEAKFDYFKFDQLANPFGILFQPKAIEKAFSDCVEQRYYSAKDLLNFDGAWLSLNHHSKFNQRDSEQILSNINTSIKKAHAAICSSTHIIITLGTSWTYRWKEDGTYVANCHKIPQKNFYKEILSSKDILLSLKNTIKLVRKVNPEARFIFTVSPVRHLKDGFMENTLSKALLHQAIHEIRNDDSVNYFPSYEIMMDDLRDYRFYKKDLVHPNELGIDYIWEVFKNTWMRTQTHATMVKIDQIQKSLLHKPFDPDSKKHLEFLLQLNKQIERLTDQYPEIVFHKKRK